MAFFEGVTGVVLAAGMGKRLGALTHSIPKALIRVGEVTLIDYGFAFLSELGVQNVGVLGGYQFTQLANHVQSVEPKAKFIENTRYESQNGVSLLSVLQEVSGDVLICDVDYVRTHAQAQRMRGSFSEATLFVSDGEVSDPDVMRVAMTAERRVSDLSKTLENYQAVSSGMFFVPGSKILALREAMQQAVNRLGAEQARVEDGLKEFVTMGHALHAFDVGARDWLEIDTPEELAEAERRLQAEPAAYILPQHTSVLTDVSCSVCGTSDAQVVDDRLSKEGRLRNVMCVGCGHVYISPRASEDVYDRYYRTGFSVEFNKVSSEDNDELIAGGAASKTERVMRFLKPSLRDGLRVLEIGSGYGNLLAAIRDRYHADVTGIEPDPIGQRVAKKVFHLDLIGGTLEDAIEGLAGGNTYDLIIMHHVLEHMLDPEVTVGVFDRLLTDKGRIYIGVPNMTAMMFPRSMFFRFPHVSNYSPYTIFLFLWRYGWKIVRCDDLSKPLSVIVTRVTDAAQMISLSPIVRRSVPKSRILRSVRGRDVYHRVRLFFKAHRGKLLPDVLKRQIKRIRSRI